MRVVDHVRVRVPRSLRALVGVALAVTVLATAVPAAARPAGAAPAGAVPAGAGPAGAGLVPPLPSSMAATGDSITRAYDLNWSHVFRDDPAESWATGTDDSVDSQYRRLLAIDPAISGHTDNDASSGADMSALDAQVSRAAGQHVDYLTVLMGANDLCTSSIATMTPTATFTAEFSRALGDFTARDPGATVFVSSIPNLYQLWSTLHGNRVARLWWQIFGTCPSMLSSSNTESQRQQVLSQEKADNGALASVCATYRRCVWDGLATFDVDFPASDISSVDYFHPDGAGQALLASTTWQVGPWAGRS